MRTQTRSLAYLLTLTVLLLVGCNEHNPVEADREMALSEEVPTAAQQTNLQIPITGEIDGDEFTATFEVLRFIVRQGEVVAVGRLTDIQGLEDLDLLRLLRRAFQLVVGGVLDNGVCQVLSLTLGPLHLELLGLIIDLNQVELDITADPSEGILGQLLCALAGGLDLDLQDLLQLADLLNQLTNADITPTP